MGATSLIDLHGCMPAFLVDPDVARSLKQTQQPRYPCETDSAFFMMLDPIGQNLDFSISFFEISSDLAGLVRDRQKPE